MRSTVFWVTPIVYETSIFAIPRPVAMVSEHSKNTSNWPKVSKLFRSDWTSCLTYLESTFSLLGVDIYVNKRSTVMSVDHVYEPIAWEIFLCNKLWIIESGDDENNDPCLNKALLQVTSLTHWVTCVMPILYNLLQWPAPAQQLLHSKLLCGLQWHCYYLL